jgi:flavin-dependent dehydrogenase
VSTGLDVAVVGGGPAGAVTAMLLARSGHEVVLLERAPSWRWHACGVFASPATIAALRRVGLDPPTIARCARPIPAMRVEALDGTHARLTYGDGDGLREPAVGFDREQLDGSLLDLAREVGVEVQRGVGVSSMDLEPRPRLTVRDEGGERTLRPALVVGADGIRSLVARSAGTARTARLGRRIGLTFHVRDPRPAAAARDARMVVVDGAYVGLAPVPGSRLNVGIVLASDRWLRALAEEGASTVVSSVLAAVPSAADDPVRWANAERCDPIEGAAPLGHRVRRRAGAGWLLVGDAAGFLDPFTGEGIHRALVSAELAAVAADAHLRGDRTALEGFDRALGGRFRTKDLLSLVVQAFLARPTAFRYALRRLSGRPTVRETMGLVMGDLVPAGRALDPRFLAALLRP